MIPLDPGPLAWSAAGGVLIGTAATLLLWLNGRIAGISGIVNGLVNRGTTDRGWRAAFIAGLMLAGGVTLAIVDVPAPREGYPVPLLLLGGLLVGYGTSLGSGCTSGHGVCGLARLSQRSLIAVVVFMATAMITVYLLRQVAGVA